MWAIVGNKQDLNNDEAVSENDARELAKTLDAIFIKTTAKDPDGINKLFIQIGEKLLAEIDISKIIQENLKIENPGEMNSKCCDCSIS